MADNPNDYLHEIKLVGIGGIVTGILAWVGGIIKSTLKKIDDSEDTKAELHAFKNETAIKLEAIKEDISELKLKKNDTRK